MKVKILGCGPSYGVPSLSRGFGLCDPKNPKNIRFRSSVLIENNDTNILIDSGPEIRIQLLRVGSPKLDAVLYTHEHYDHMGGADDLRSVMTEEDETLPIYLTKDAAKHFKNILQYLFRTQTQGTDVFQLNLIKPYHAFQVGDMSIQPIPQKHGNGHSIGYRIGDFAYSTDVVSMDEKAFHALEGIKVWVLGVVTPIANNKHINIETALEWIERIKPERAYFTHMGSRMDYDTLCRNLPDYIRPVYDGMEIEV